ncbi:MAG TPA: VWA domain-containing protein [Planctomycetota bacterium]|nr:VWA domain-containing protein [Planctomycetota bacterium]
MVSWFSQPWLLLLVPALSVLLVAQWFRVRGGAGNVGLQRRRFVRRLILQGCAGLLLALAAAGLRIPREGQRQQIVVAADVSSSIFDLSSQSTRLNELARALDPQQAELAFTVFGGTAGTERAFSPLAAATERNTTSTRRKKVEAPLLPDLLQLTTVVDRNATDVGSAINFARSLFPDSRASSASRAILLLSDFRSTRGSEQSAAAALSGSGIDLLPTPAVLGPSADVHIASLRVPEKVQIGRSIPIEVTVASQTPCTLRVAVWRQKVGSEDYPVDFKTVTLATDAATTGGELRASVRVLDKPETAGIAVYTARISGTDGDLPGDISSNNVLSAALRVEGPALWAVLTRSGSTLDRLAGDPARPLGVQTRVYDVKSLPSTSAAYDQTAGIVVDGFSAGELTQGPAVTAIADAVDNGKALIAFGGEKAFGAGGHREGTWERLLPIEMTPEDDRTRSVLFLIDVSKSMDEKMGAAGAGVRKIDFAAEQLAQAVQRLKPLDRLGLITFSGTAQLAAPLSAEPTRNTFLSAVKKVQIEANTDLLAALKLASETLAKDDAEEQLVVLLSDGIQTIKRPSEEIVQAARTLCPQPRDEKSVRRTTLFSFGIDVSSKDANSTGEKLLKSLAEAGGGSYSPEFLKLAQRLEQAFEAQKKDFYVRYESFGLRAAYEHPLLGPSGSSWPLLGFRNRVRAKPDTETLLLSAAPNVNPSSSRKPDPLLVLSGSHWPAVSRRAALALSLDGEAGSALLSSESGRRLLPSLLEWAEARGSAGSDAWTVHAEPGDDDAFDVEVRGSDSASGLPISGRRLTLTLTSLNSAGEAAEQVRTKASTHPLHASAPGVYRAMVPGLTQGIYRLSIHDAGRLLHERFVTVPYSAELRRFGTDRAAMQALAAKAGGDSQVIESATDLFQWASKKKAAREMVLLSPWLIAAAIVLLLVEIGIRRS